MIKNTNDITTEFLNKLEKAMYNNRSQTFANCYNEIITIFTLNHNGLPKKVLQNVFNKRPDLANIDFDKICLDTKGLNQQEDFFTKHNIDAEEARNEGMDDEQIENFAMLIGQQENNQMNNNTELNKMRELIDEFNNELILYKSQEKIENCSKILQQSFEQSFTNKTITQETKNFLSFLSSYIILDEDVVNFIDKNKGKTDVIVEMCKQVKEHLSEILGIEIEEANYKDLNFSLFSNINLLDPIMEFIKNKDKQVKANNVNSVSIYRNQLKENDVNQRNRIHSADNIHNNMDINNTANNEKKKESHCFLWYLLPWNWSSCCNSSAVETLETGRRNNDKDKHSI